MHHIASDGWSMPIMVKELISFYQAVKQNKTPNLGKLAIQYADYSIWQRNYLKGDILNQQLTYWEEKLQGHSPLFLPTDFSRPKIQSTKGASVYLKMDKKISSQFKELAKKEDSTLFMTLLAVFKILLYRYTNQPDIIVGTSVANRLQTSVEPLIGFFVNTLALRSDLSNNPTFQELLAQIRNTTLELSLIHI